MTQKIVWRKIKKYNNRCKIKSTMHRDKLLINRANLSTKRIKLAELASSNSINYNFFKKLEVGLLQMQDSKFG